MSKIHGKNSVAFVKEYKVQGDANQMSLTYSIDTSEVTGFGDTAKQNVEGKYQWSAGMEGYWNSVTNQIDPIVQSLIGGGTKILGVYPAGTTPGNKGYDGYGMLSNYKPALTVDGPVVFSADFTGDLELYRSTILDAGVKTVGTVSSSPQNIGTTGVGGYFIGVYRALPGSHGTCSISLYSGTSQVAQDENMFSASNFTGQAVVIRRDATPTTQNWGPWFKTTYTIATPGDSFDLVLSAAVTIPH